MIKFLLCFHVFFQIPESIHFDKRKQRSPCSNSEVFPWTGSIICILDGIFSHFFSLLYLLIICYTTFLQGRNTDLSVFDTPPLCIFHPWINVFAHRIFDLCCSQTKRFYELADIMIRKKSFWFESFFQVFFSFESQAN